MTTLSEKPSTMTPAAATTRPIRRTLSELSHRIKRLPHNRDAWRGVLCLVDQAVVSATNFLTTVLIGRMCVEAELGAFAAGLSLMVIILVSIPAGTVWLPYTTFAPRLSGRRAQLYLGSACAQTMALCLAISVGLMLIGMTGLLQGTKSDLASLFGVLPWVATLILMQLFIRRIMLAHMVIIPLLLLDVAFSVMQLSGLVMLHRVGSLSASTALGVIGIASLIIVVLAAVAFRNHILIRPRSILLDWKKNWKLGRWGLPTFIVQALNNGLYVWIIALLHGTAAAGAYAAAMSIVALLNPVFLGFQNFYSPFASHTYAQHGVARFTKVTVISTIALASVLALFVVAIYLVGGGILPNVYQGRYQNQHALIGTMAIAYMASVLATPVGFGLMAIDRADGAFKAQCTQLAIGLVFGTALCLQFGIIGAATANCVGTSSSLAIQWASFLRSPKNV